MNGHCSPCFFNWSLNLRIGFLSTSPIEEILQTKSTLLKIRKIGDEPLGFVVAASLLITDCQLDPR